MGERKLLERSFSFPHTPYLSRTLKCGGYYCLVRSTPPRVILSGGRSPKSNSAGVCEAQDLRGGRTNRPRSRHYVSHSVFDSLRSLRMTRTGYARRLRVLCSHCTNTGKFWSSFFKSLRGIGASSPIFIVPQNAGVGEFLCKASHNHRPCRWLALAPVGHVDRLSLKARRKSLPTARLSLACP